MSHRMPLNVISACQICERHVPVHTRCRVVATCRARIFLTRTHDTCRMPYMTHAQHGLAFVYARVHAHAHAYACIRTGTDAHMPIGGGWMVWLARQGRTPVAWDAHILISCDDLRRRGPGAYEDKSQLVATGSLLGIPVKSKLELEMEVAAGVPGPGACAWRTGRKDSYMIVMRYLHSGRTLLCNLLLQLYAHDWIARGL